MRFLYVCVLLLFTFGAVYAAAPVVDQEEQYQLGLRAYEAKDYDKAYEIWLPLGIVGYAKAAHKLGYIHSEGLGREIDLIEAQKWYLISAKTGNRGSMFNLAHILFSSEVGIFYPIKGLCWLIRSERLGLSKASKLLKNLEKNGAPKIHFQQANELEEKGRPCSDLPLS